MGGECNMGRNKKPMAMNGDKGFTKAERSERLELEKKINLECDNFKIPTFIKNNKEALKEFKRLKKELLDREVLSNLDNISLAQYCLLYSNYIDCIALEEEKGLFVEYVNKGGATNTIEAPWVKLRRATETQMINIGKNFGLSPVDRQKLVRPKTEEEGDEISEIFG